MGTDSRIGGRGGPLGGAFVVKRVLGQMLLAVGLSPIPFRKKLGVHVGSTTAFGGDRALGHCQLGWEGVWAGSGSGTEWSWVGVVLAGEGEVKGFFS